MPGRLYTATCCRGMAAVYDRMLAASEEAGFREMRREVVSGARGKTLELGAGTGLNFAHYGPDVTELVLLEPDPHMAAKLREKVEGADRRDVRIVSDSAERLPFEDASFDTVVGTLVLCTIPDHERAIAEVARVLRPGGRLLFLEHVRSGDPSVARWQDRLRPVWAFVAGGCQCNRDTLSALQDSPLDVADARRGRIPKAAKIVRPTIAGAATKP
jgi:ubiquinone/menaquinone biosynthesis C-methylase UbiE